MISYSKYYYTIIGFLLGFIISLTGMTIEDFQHNIPIGSALQELHHFLTPIIIGILTGIFTFLYWKMKNIKEQAQKTLLLQQEKNKTIISNTSDVIAIIDSEGIIQYKSDNITRNFGWHPQELLGQTAWVTIHPNDLEMVQQTFATVLSDINTSVNIRFNYQCKNGTYVPVHLTAKNMIHHPHIGGVLCNYQDISELVKGEKELILSEYKHRTLFENMTDMVVMLDINQKIIDVNKAAEEFLEYSRAELLDMSIQDMVYQDDSELSEEYFDELKTSGSYNMYEGRVITKTGKVMWVQVNSTEFIIDGVKMGSQDICRDITNRKKTEIKLQRAIKKLNDSNDDKNRFISIIAHDIKNPFNAILGFLNMLTTDFKNMDLKEIEEIVNNSYHSAQNLYHLLEEILVWVNANSDKIPCNPELLSLTDICTQAIGNLELEASKKQITIGFSSVKTQSVFADKAMLKTILRNLVSNSIKFCHPKGRIEILAEDHSDAVIITVSDNGIGMGKEILEKLFNIREKYSTRGTADEKGTGLGLLLCKEFVEKHQGVIWAESIPGTGSQFKFKLPLL